MTNINIEKLPRWKNIQIGELPRWTVHLGNSSFFMFFIWVIPLSLCLSIWVIPQFLCLSIWIITLQMDKHKDRGITQMKNIDVKELSR
jgi:hypothetical protein